MTTQPIHIYIPPAYTIRNGKEPRDNLRILVIVCLVLHFQIEFSSVVRVIHSEWFGWFGGVLKRLGVNDVFVLMVGCSIYCHQLSIHSPNDLLSNNSVNTISIAEYLVVYLYTVLCQYLIFNWFPFAYLIEFADVLHLIGRV